MYNVIHYTLIYKKNRKSVPGMIKAKNGGKKRSFSKNFIENI